MTESHLTSREPRKHNWLLIIILVLVAAQVIISGYQTVMTQIRYQEEIAHRNQVILSVENYTKDLDSITTQLLKEYQQVVYSESNKANYQSQEVLGNEYTFKAIMLLVRQNSRLMKVLAQMK